MSISTSSRRTHSSRCLKLESLEIRCMLAGDIPLEGPFTFPTDGGTTAVTVGDMNGDGIVDLVTSGWAFHGGSGNVGLLMGNGDGTFAPRVRLSTTGPHQTLADFDGDGDLDIGFAFLSNGLKVVLNEGVSEGQV